MPNPRQLPNLRLWNRNYHYPGLSRGDCHNGESNTGVVIVDDMGMDARKGRVQSAFALGPSSCKGLYDSLSFKLKLFSGPFEHTVILWIAW